VVATWAEAGELFGCVRQFAGQISLEPGLVHKANGGILVVPLKTLLLQPLLWLRLKQMVVTKRFDWVAPDESRPLPVSL
ncbi:AAA family ATPase, partial [Enterobacter kobei]|nr:AAA family ATPase [Enterobacter kobei]